MFFWTNEIETALGMDNTVGDRQMNRFLASRVEQVDVQLFAVIVKGMTAAIDRYLLYFQIDCIES